MPCRRSISNHQFQWDVLAFGEAAPEPGRYGEAIVRLGLVAAGSKQNHSLQKSRSPRRPWLCLIVKVAFVE